MAAAGSGIFTLAALRARCIIDQATRCWIWQGAKAGDGTPRIHSLDLARMEKRTMTGPAAAWTIAHEEPPLPGRLIFRACQHRLCLNPAHLRDARNNAEIGLHIRRAGTRVGNSVEARRANQRIACLAAGNPPTDPEIVRAIRNAPPTVTGQALSRQYGIAHQTVSRIRRGLSHRDVV